MREASKRWDLRLPTVLTSQGWVRVVMGPGQKFLTRVGSVFCGSGRVGSAIYGLG